MKLGKFNHNGNLHIKYRPAPLVDVGPVLQYKFLANEPLDEATESMSISSGTVSIQNSSMYTSGSTVNNYFYRKLPSILKNTKFTIELTIRSEGEIPSTSNIIGTWNPSNEFWLLSVINNNLVFQWNNGTATTGTRQVFTFSNVQVPSDQDVHLAVCRDDTMLYGFVNGQLAGSFEVSFAGHTNVVSGSIFSTRSMATTNNYFNGYRKNIRIVNDKALYVAPFTLASVTMADVKPDYYTPEDASLVVGQITCKRNSLFQETMNTPTLLLTGLSNSTTGRFVTTTNNTSGFQFSPVTNWQSGDYTIELYINLSTVGAGGAILIGQWTSSGGTDIGWSISMQQNGSVRHFYSTDGLYDQANGNSGVLQAPNGTLVLNKDTHVCAMRKNGVIGLFVDGVRLAQVNEARPLWNSQIPIRNTWTAPADGYALAERWNIRCISKAMYDINGFVPPVRLPTFPNLLTNTGSYSRSVLSGTTTTADVMGNIIQFNSSGQTSGGGYQKYFIYGSKKVEIIGNTISSDSTQQMRYGLTNTTPTTFAESESDFNSGTFPYAYADRINSVIQIVKQGSVIGSLPHSTANHTFKITYDFENNQFTYAVTSGTAQGQSVTTSLDSTITQNTKFAVCGTKSNIQITSVKIQQ